MSVKRAEKLKKRDLRQRKKTHRAAQTLGRARMAFDRVTIMLGIFDFFEEQPPEFTRTFILNHDPFPDIVLDEGLDAEPEMRALLEEVKEVVSTPKVLEVVDWNFYTCIYDLWRYYYDIQANLKMLRDQLRRQSVRYRPKFVEQVEGVWKTITVWDEKYAGRAFFEAMTRIDVVLNRRLRLDERILSYSISTPVLFERATITIRRAVPEKTAVVVDGQPRTAFRCGRGGLNGIRYPTWQSSRVGVPGPDRPLPIYVQKHAIVRARERLPRTWPEYLIHNEIFAAVRRGDLHPAEEGRFLVPFSVLDCRVGYLVAQPLADKVIIRTFLFLTMQGTPEFTLLREKLRIGRAGIAYHKLDDFLTFIGSDIKSDSTLCRLLEECGCGHLLSLGREASSAVWLPGCSARLRADLGISEHNGGVKIGGIWRRLCAPSATEEVDVSAN